MQEDKPHAGGRSEDSVVVLSRDSLSGVINAIDDPVFVKDERHRWVLLNDSLCRLLNFPREKLLGKTDYDFSPKEEADVFWEKDDLVLRTGETNINEERVTWKGEEHIISTKKSLFVDPETGCRYIAGTIRDITERKKLEDERERLLVEIKDHSDQLAAANKQLVILRASEQEYLRAIRSDLEVAARIQSDFLPDSIPHIDGWDIAAQFAPAKEVAGDFYDLFRIDEDRLGVVIADVCGKSVGAAIFMALVRTLVRAFSMEQHDPGAVLDTVNRYLIEHHLHRVPYMFATVFYGVLELSTGRLRYTNAGHIPPLVLTQHGPERSLAAKCIAIGLSRDSKYESSTEFVGCGQTLFAYTDGLVESHAEQRMARNAVEMLYAVLKSKAGDSAQEIIDAAEKSLVARDKDGHTEDDVTLIALRRL